MRMKNALVFLLSLSSLSSFAEKKRTFTSDLKTEATQHIVSGVILTVVGVPLIPVYGFGLILMASGIDAIVEGKHLKRDVKRIKAGHVLANKDKFHWKEVDKAQRRFDTFYYDKLAKRQGIENLQRDDVIQALETIYTNGLKLQIHDEIYDYELGDASHHSGLCQKLFQNGSLDWYRNKLNAALEKEKQEEKMEKEKEKSQEDMIIMELDI